MTDMPAVPLRWAVQALVAADGMALGVELERGICEAIQGELARKRLSPTRRGLNRLLEARKGRVIPFQLSEFDALLAHYLLLLTNIGDTRYGRNASAAIYSDLSYVDAGWAEFSGSRVTYHDRWVPLPEKGLVAWLRPAGRVAWQSDLLRLSEFRPEAAFVVGDSVAIQIHLHNMPAWGLQQLVAPTHGEWTAVLEGFGKEGDRLCRLRAVAVDVLPDQSLVRVTLKSPEVVIQVTAASRDSGARIRLTRGSSQVLAKLPHFDEEGAIAPAWVTCIDDRRIYLWSERDSPIRLPPGLVEQCLAKFRWFAMSSD